MSADPLADMPGAEGVVARSLADLVAAFRANSARLAYIEQQLDQLLRQQSPTIRFAGEGWTTFGFTAPAPGAAPLPPCPFCAEPCTLCARTPSPDEPAA